MFRKRTGHLKLYTISRRLELYLLIFTHTPLITLYSGLPVSSKQNTHAFTLLAFALANSSFCTLWSTLWHSLKEKRCKNFKRIKINKELKILNNVDVNITETAIVELSLGQKIKAAPKRKWVDSQTRLRRIVLNYETYEILDYLTAVGQTIVILNL